MINLLFFVLKNKLENQIDFQKPHKEHPLYQDADSK
jgi:hypothetical protein